MRRNKNSEVIVQVIVLSITALVLLFGMLSGTVNYYVHPRYHVGIWISILILILFAISLLFERKSGRHNANLKQYIIYLLPIIAAFLFPAKGLSNVEMAIAGSNLSSAQISQSTSDNILEEDSYDLDTYETIENQEQDQTYAYDDADYSSWEDITPTEEIITEYETMSDKYIGEVVDGATIIEDDYYASWYYDVYDYLEDFTGKRYQFLAQVYSMEELEDNQFLAGRYVMVCCAADLSGYGMICESDLRGELKEDEWITVTATIKEYDYKGTMVPMLADAVITKAEAPSEEYVYYNFY